MEQKMLLICLAIAAISFSIKTIIDSFLNIKDSKINAKNKNKLSNAINEIMDFAKSYITQITEREELNKKAWEEREAEFSKEQWKNNNPN